MNATDKLTIRFVGNPTFISAAIREVTNSFCSHAEFLIDGKWVCAMPPKIVLQEENYLSPSWERRYEVTVEADAKKEANVWALAQVGKAYNRLDIAGLLFHNRDMFNPDEFICSQLTYLYMWKAKLMPLNVNPEYAHLVTPEMLHLAPVFIGNCVKKVG